MFFERFAVRPCYTMNVLTKIAYYLIILISFVVITASMLSLSQNNTQWWMKVLDFPRIQCLAVALVSLIAFALLNRTWGLWSILLTVGLVATLVVQAYFVFPYTPLTDPEVAAIAPAEVDPPERVRLMIANVYMHNRQDAALMTIVEKNEPDMLLLMEVNQWWIDHLPDLRERYPHYHELPIDNTYGMALYSRYALKNLTTMFLQHDSVPSFHTDIQLPNGRSFRFHGVHPVPPVLSKHPDNEGQKEEELTKVGQLVKDRKMPAVVAGDFNDVAWSNTSRLFQMSGGLEDIRIGRGLYSSFDAQSYVMRWPLDHVYVSDEFRVANFRRLDAFGSDHFPIYVELVLTE